VLDRLVPVGTRCALIDAPLRSNVGDSAIWLGQRAVLGMLGAKVRYTCDVTSYDPAHLAACLPDGPILLSGGGTLGDLWEASQQLRERVIRDFPDRRIVQLPQSIHFAKHTNLTRARRVFDTHPDLTLLLRDRHSLGQARVLFEAQSLLAPDLGFAVPPAELVRGAASRDVVWLARQDRESARDATRPSREERRAAWDAARATRPGRPAAPCGPVTSGVGPYVFDWTREPGGPAWRNATEVLMRRRTRALHRIRTGDDPATAAAALLTAYDGLARLRLERGCRLLTAGRVAVTDRLHGHVLGLLLDLPHVVVADRYGKMRNYWETWTSDAARGHRAVWAGTHAAAERAAGRLLDLVA
jgi:pyruvyl transferase EpsO